MVRFTYDELIFLSDLMLTLLNSYQRDISLLDKSSFSYDFDLDFIKDKYNFVLKIYSKLGALHVDK